VEFKGYEGKNRIGAEAVRCLLEPDPAIRFAEEIELALAWPPLSLWCRAAGAIVADTLRLKLGAE
jgi:hypothetical protein